MQQIKRMNYDAQGGPGITQEAGKNWQRHLIHYFEVIFI